MIPLRCGFGGSDMITLIVIFLVAAVVLRVLSWFEPEPEVRERRARVRPSARLRA